MAKDYIVVDGVKYFKKAEKADPEVETPETTEETPENLDEKVDEVAEKIMAKLGIDQIKKKLEEVTAKTDKISDKANDLVDFEAIMGKSKDQLTSREKILGFFQALIQRNEPVLKALAEGAAADGGYLFPDEFRAEVIRDLVETPHMRNEVTVIPMKRDVLNVPTLATSPKVTWTAENATKSTSTATFDQVTLTVKKMAAIMYISDELVADSTEIDIVNFIVRLFSEAIGREEDRVITAGNGTTQPSGYSGNATIAHVTCSGNLDFNNIINLVYELPTQYQGAAKFFIHKNNIRELRKVTDTNGRYIWQEPLSQTQPATILGYPVVEDNNLPESSIFFGDLKRAYWLGDRQQMTVKISNDTETAFTKDQTAIRVVTRIAGNVVLPQALKELVSIP